MIPSKYALLTRKKPLLIFWVFVYIYLNYKLTDFEATLLTADAKESNRILAYYT